MINFRFHLVSLIAVFLALALGVVVGATVIDQAIVDGLNSRIDRVEDEADAQRGENSALRDELDRLGSYVADTAPFTVGGRLDGVPVVVVATRHTDGDTVGAAAELARMAGAASPGVLWIEDSWVRADEAARAQLAEIVGAPPDGDGVRAAAWNALAERLAAGSANPEADLLTVLSDAGFVSFEPADDAEVELAAYPGAGARVLLLDGSDAPAEADALVTNAARAFAGVELATVAGEVFREVDDGPGRGSRVAGVRDDGELAAIVSTVDDVDLVEGQVAAILALADLGRGVVGQYGYGDGASRSVPAVANT